MPYDTKTRRKFGFDIKAFKDFLNRKKSLSVFLVCSERTSSCDRVGGISGWSDTTFVDQTRNKNYSTSSGLFKIYIYDIKLTN